MPCRSPPPSRVSKGLNLASPRALSPCLGRGGCVAGCVPLPAAPSHLAGDKNSTWGGHDSPCGWSSSIGLGGCRSIPVTS